ncbi:hypothetical protein SO802_033747 [Lithocarpus litseifolius]|uniref:aminobutyraldehyde dehydrogenase n=1 Tax=Lithocarpus litseifolius TaxID=425828 RepID=A0AAW2BEM6_9ROSI
MRYSDILQAPEYKDTVSNQVAFANPNAPVYPRLAQDNGMKNYPLLMAAWKIAPALAAGCTAIQKPSELASVTCLELAEICRQVDIPPGVLNIVTGLGSEAGAPLASNPHVDKIAFTGSTATGIKVVTTAAQMVKPISLDLGGKSPIIVFEDADPYKAAEWTIYGCFMTNGQICSATSCLLVHESIAADFLEKLIDWSKNIKISDPMEEGCRLGAIVSKGQALRTRIVWVNCSQPCLTKPHGEATNVVVLGVN